MTTCLASNMGLFTHGYGHAVQEAGDSNLGCDTI